MNFNTEKVKLLIAEQELTLSSLSKKADMPLITVSQVIRGNRKPTMRTIGKIARGLGVHVEQIVEQEVV